MVDRFFLPQDAEPRRGTVTLDADESEHATRTRRLQAGAAVELLDGNGCVAHGVIVRASRSACVVEINNVVQLHRDQPITHLAVSVPRGPRMDHLVDACAQLGVATIAPVIFERSVSAREDVSPARFDRWNRIAREAAKQSGEPFTVRLEEIVTFERFLQSTANGRRMLLHPEPDAPKLASALPPPSESLQIVVGPEGGLAPGEFGRASASDLCIVQLGRGLLRIEMAAVAACAIARLR
ncbi:MAG: RsmE family RNA methyltransferase [Planctomycetes bacterium]|nr:RsmE family RNA methyltransferase [Planctomycetota bacterium]